MYSVEHWRMLCLQTDRERKNKKKFPKRGNSKNLSEHLSMTWRVRTLRITHYCISPRSQKCIWPARYKQRIYESHRWLPTLHLSRPQHQESNGLNSEAGIKQQIRRSLNNKEGIETINQKSRIYVLLWDIPKSMLRCHVCFSWLLPRIRGKAFKGKSLRD